MLDTHALVWWVTDDSSLSKKARKAIEAETRAELIDPALKAAD